MSYYNRIMPRLNGDEIEERFDYYLCLVKKGIAGFIVFGGELETVKAGLEKFQQASDKPLIIASDLEQGLGQQIKGGTLFPPAMAIASALRNALETDAALTLNKIYSAFAHEAEYAGINTIFAPVLDINTNPDNPIIATRAFGEDAETVSFFGCEMIKTLQENSIIACGKHFPGHGDTEADSHISLPMIKKDISALEQNELVPFRNAINSGVSMIMLGHLSVPAIDPSGMPVSVSENTVNYLRNKMGFKGFTITDAMNMGGLSGYTEEEASLMALKAGVDLILHPSDPDNVASYLKHNKLKFNNITITNTYALSVMPERLNRASILINPLYPPFLRGNKLDSRLRGNDWRGDGTAYYKTINNPSPDFSEHRRLSEELARQAIKIDGDFKIRKPFVLMLDDENSVKSSGFMDALRQKFPDVKHLSIHAGSEMLWDAIPSECDLIACVFSQVKAWKGNANGWLKQSIDLLKDRAEVMISFGNPYLLHNVKGRSAKVYAYWDSESAQTATAEIIIKDKSLS